ncbi:hypothetical protein J8273_0628 [Carpediemonas membranifera]|uniref:Uncharacterized protein n=1 Tax=Carpediemonas membranifera TaxID=201153 RepID=A0A8J6AZ01_9EUKA|nr:hypothetical protein J8273_0628 [Carpediemonas membranifera]|eukprot:KAG9397498.1 hypothetical protein J8273_0628 [Carpediemonas membranifera]
MNENLPYGPTRSARIAENENEPRSQAVIEQRKKFVELCTCMPREWRELPGDVPTLLRRAFDLEFAHEEALNSLHDIRREMHREDARVIMKQILASLHATTPPAIPPETPSEDLPDQPDDVDGRRGDTVNPPRIRPEASPQGLYTLPPGVLWSCLMGARANPDIDDSVYDDAEACDCAPSLLRAIQETLTPEAKCLWFLCKKFKVVREDEERRCETRIYKLSRSRCYVDRMHMGRLFMLVIQSSGSRAFTRARMPIALELYESAKNATFIAKTHKGLWGWGDTSDTAIWGSNIEVF